MSKTLNSSYQSSPLTVAQGGTGITTTTAYGLLLGGTSSTGALQNGGTGSSGQLYLSGGASSTGTWTNQVGATCFQYVSQTTASSSASVAFSSLSSNYFAYKIILDAIVPATNAAKLYITLSYSGGYFSTGYSYTLLGLSESGTSLSGNGSNAAQIQIVDNGIVNTASVANHWEITFYNPTVSANYNGLTYLGRYKDSTSGLCVAWGHGAQGTTDALTAIKFAMSSGNISTGSFTLFGMLT